MDDCYKSEEEYEYMYSDVDASNSSGGYCDTDKESEDISLNCIKNHINENKKSKKNVG